MKVKMEPGRYFVGDLCYAITDRDTWLDVLDATGCFQVHSPVFPGVVAGATAYGDGSYPGYVDDVPREFPVDSGTIGVIHENHWRLGEKGVEQLEKVGAIVEFEKSFFFENRSGRFLIGDRVTIDTDFDEDEVDPDDSDDFDDSEEIW